VQSVDLLTGENGRSHRTYDYELMERPTGADLVIRRGQPFHLGITFNRRFQQDDDGLSLVFTVADTMRPSPNNGTLITVPLTLMTDRVEPGDWSVRLVHAGQNTMRVQVTTSATSIVGAWKMEIDTRNKNSGKSLSFSIDRPIHLLFNPWCPEDQVYLDNEEWLNEYVMADTGLIWRGSHNRMRPCYWNFAQFEKDILECCIYLISKVSKLTVAGRADPVRVVRAISAVVNSPDDNGVLEGNWSGDYQGGKAPTKWQGSMLILQSFWNTKRPVKYGQCWVFSGIVTTVCRALGIPVRSVTNFASAHDTQGSLTIDTFVGSDGKIMEELNSDSIWNFHVWNEVWMERPDLAPEEYHGWQAIDATPQEESDGQYRCGPGSLAAIKQGDVKKPYDTTFIFAEVNADKVYWKYNGKDSPLKLIHKKTDEIGLHISTKAVGKFAREDITHLYKHKDNSVLERESVLRALRQCESMFSRYYLNESLEDVKFDFKLVDDIVIGSSFKVLVEVSNRNPSKEYTVSVTLRVESTDYTGKIKGLVKRHQFQEEVIRPGFREKLEMTVTYEEYAPELSDQANFNIGCLASVLDTDYEFFTQDDFRVRKPDIRISAPKDVALGEEFPVDVSFINPLPVPLNKPKFVIEGPGFGQPVKIALATVPANGEAKTRVTMKALRTGERTIAAKFYSTQLSDVDGHFSMTITSRNEL